VDVSTGLWATVSIMAALARRTEGNAEQLRTSLVDSGFFLMAHQIMGYLGSGTMPGRLGSAAPSTAPYEAFDTADGTIMIAAATDRLFARLCTALDLDDLPADTRFGRVADRVTHRTALSQLIEARLRTDTTEAWLGRITAAGVPAGPVNDLAAALAHPVTAERGMVVDALAGRIPGLKQVRLPIDEDGHCPMSQPPALGAHTEEVLAQAGLTATEIRHLVSSQVMERTA
jgi:crotonobetainyl-CoA:carnitine CoA-transferase CaiB-like acyl-CoA transferase